MLNLLKPSMTKQHAVQFQINLEIANGTSTGPNDVHLISSDQYKRGPFSLKRNDTQKEVAGPTPHKVQYLDHRQLGV